MAKATSGLRNLDLSPCKQKQVPDFLDSQVEMLCCSYLGCGFRTVYAVRRSASQMLSSTLDAAVALDELGRLG